MHDDQSKTDKGIIIFKLLNRFIHLVALLLQTLLLFYSLKNETYTTYTTDVASDKIILHTVHKLRRRLYLRKCFFFLYVSTCIQPRQTSEVVLPFSNRQQRNIDLNITAYAGFQFKFIAVFSSFCKIHALRFMWNCQKGDDVQIMKGTLSLEQNRIRYFTSKMLLKRNGDKESSRKYFQSAQYTTDKH